jgi:GNAT superfamily N-acetyltransferase
MTNYQLVPYNNTLLEEFFKFCKDTSMYQDSAATNMWTTDWEDQPNTLPYLLFKDGRYAGDRGEFFLVIYQNEIIGCSGIYFSDIDARIAIAGCRTWINKEHRNKSLPREILLPAQKKWAQDRNAEVIGLTFNDYNKNLIETWKRKRLGENRSPRQPYHLFYNNFNEIDFPVNIQYTKQWLIYEKLDSKFKFDWNTIKWK